MSRSSVRVGCIVAALLCFLFTNGAMGDWPQLGGSSTRNNVANVTGLPSTWDVGEFDRKTGKWDDTKAKNIKWIAQLGSITYGTPVVADGRIFVGTNNGVGNLKRYPSDVDLGCLVCFREFDGQFQWQFSAEKLPTGRVHDMPMSGIVSSPLVEGDRAWFVSNRGEVVCIDTHGFYDDEDDGPIVGEDIVLSFHSYWRDLPDTITPLCKILDQGKWPEELRADLARSGEPVEEHSAVKVVQQGKLWSCNVGQGDVAKMLTIRREDKQLRVLRNVTSADKREADVVWRFDTMARLGTSQHNLAVCSITSWKNTLFVCTGNGVVEDHFTIPAPDAPSFIALDKHTGEVLWTSNLPGRNIHHAQWSSPAVGVLGGVPQAIFCGGDGWVYSFHAEQWENSRPQLLWKFDTNAKDAVLALGLRGTRNEPIAPPVLYDNKVFVTTGQDPEHGEGQGCVWCIDATKKLDGSDVSAQLVLDAEDNPVPPRRMINIDRSSDERLADNPNSAVVWKYDTFDLDGNGKITVDEQMHRSFTSVVVHEDLVFCTDFNGFIHCLDRRTGKPHWSCDMLAACWAAPLVADGKLFVTDEDGDVAVLYPSADPIKAGMISETAKDGTLFFTPAVNINMAFTTYCHPVASNGVLYIATTNRLIAIEKTAGP